MTTITREQLHERARRKVKELEFAITQSAFTSIRDGLNEELELARIALASLTAEPVLYAAEETLAYANMGEIHLTCLSEPMGDAVIPLYTAPPVPVVPEEIEPDSNNTYDYVDGWNACRAAMLQGGQPVSNHDELALYYLQGQKDGLEWAAQLAEANHPNTGDWLYDDPMDLAKAIRKGPDMPEFAGSSPVTQDGWISCSERMPDNDESKPIAIFTGKCLGQGMFVATYDDDGFFDYWEGMEIIGVSHWMPLPEPPQQ
ncbi:DUF551 domain-containing protein [Salmonella enterica subsp. enterica]|nr:DUF551 domain-containing protein [Salmonella enterica subsp. enterica]EHR2121459.1 DUF551 domain-containing protein [Salmonella enterica subsp. enterica serovar Matopeni]EJY3612237.1 DUF551 domain-containing protein [Salmonella enterica]EIQ4618278.1 DUF551 domain-containing protein [Salmonella enterica subsp. enterica serovar Matopeni]EIQ4681343.1 DUF551 domain-containing protein [Salmonella enterica subsp. enterica serovar Matopeni]